MEQISPWLEGIFRWMHVLAGVLWIGLLFFFNWVNTQFAPKLSAEAKKEALPILLPRTLYFFRWGAAFTWVTGILLLGLIYHMGGASVMMADGAELGNNHFIGLAVLIASVLVYDLLWKNMTGMAAVGVSFLLATGSAYLFAEVLGYNTRTTTIHVGALFGTLMAFNVWFRIWPAQRKIIASIAAGEAPDGALAALAGMRSKHNTYMSVPLIYTMLVQHNVVMYEYSWMGVAAVIAIGWALTSHLYKKSAGDAPGQY
jgi:uncharacterized membrane protein